MFCFCNEWIIFSTICCIIATYFALRKSIQFIFVVEQPKPETKPLGAEPKVVKRFTLFARKKLKHLLDTAKLLWERGEYIDAKNALHLYGKRESR
jgi:hypothetical protein